MKINKNDVRINQEQKSNEIFIPIEEILSELKQIYLKSEFTDTSVKIEEIKTELSENKNSLEKKLKLNELIRQQEKLYNGLISELDYKIHNLKLDISEKLES